ncbi:MAG: DUF1573 domain-containing protein [Pirellulaceae bacterium]|nr:DUF1573 domain-containing protein [Pirellulaceae bacterium]
MLRLTPVTIFLALLLAATARGQDWAEKLFPVKSHDFGVVARNAKAEFTFRMENPYAADVHVASVRSSCGCSTPQILKSDLTTYETGGILAVFNTGSFTGKHGATITVTIDRPKFAEIQLRVDGTIRGDVVMQPGDVAFGAVSTGEAADREVLIEYHGFQSGWRIEHVHCSNPHLKCQLQPLQTVAGRPACRLTATLASDAPVGYLHEQLVLTTTDPSARQLSVPVTGRIVPPITLSPASLYLGVVPVNQQVTRKLVVMGKQPFRVVAIECDECFEVPIGDTAQKVHVLPLTFKAGDQPGKVVRTIKVRTDLGDGAEAECTASVAIVAAPAE